MIYEFAATQDLHGYDKPWAPGTLFNQWDEEWEVGTFNTTNGENIDLIKSQIRAKNYIPIEGGTTYYAASPKGLWMIFADSEKNIVDPPAGASVSGKSISIASNTSFATPEDAAFCRFYMLTTYGNVYKHDIAINYPSTETAYTPYTNVCMPEGFNIWDPSQDKMIPVYAGYVNANTRELYLRPVYQEYAGEELVGPWMSSLDPYDEDTTPTEGAFVIDFGGELESFEITPFMLQTLLDSLGIRQHFTNGAGLLNKLMDQAQGRVRSEEELLHLSRPLNVIAIGDQLPAGITFKPISKDVLPGLPGKFIR